MIELFPELVVDELQFEALRLQCKKVCDVSKRLPAFVFAASLTHCCAIEYAHVMQKSFGNFLFQVAAQFGDDAVCYMSVEPDPQTYYHRNHGFYGMAVFNPLQLAERYQVVMKRGGSVDSFQARGGDVGVIWGSSEKWAVFCDRISWETALVATSDDVRETAKASGINCLNFTSLSKYIKNQYSTKPSVAVEFIETFAASYEL